MQTFLQKEKPTCVCLQETHLKEGEEKWLRELFRGDIFHAPSLIRSKELMLETAENVPWETNMAQIDEKGSYVTLRRKWMKKELVVIGVYAPHTGQAQLWKEIFEVILQTGVMEMIMLGDFNATICNLLDRSV